MAGKAKYEEKKERFLLSLTPQAAREIGDLAQLLGETRSGLIEMIARDRRAMQTLSEILRRTA